MASGQLRGDHRSPRALWRNANVRRVLLQLAFVGAVVALLGYLYGNVVTNLRRLRIGTSFEFLDQTAGFQIANSGFDPTNTMLDAILVGVKNTAIASLLGIVLASVLGLVIGVARLSSNWLVNRAAAGYVETLRNIPVVVIILFWYLAVFLRLPPIDEAVELGGVLVLSNRALAIPWFEVRDGFAVFAAVAGLGLLAAAVIWWWRTRRWQATGAPHHRVLWSGGVLLAALVAGFAAGGAPLGLSLPERADLGTTGGYLLTPEYGALLLGLTVYTASHIAEIVRGSIQAVPKGQVEAANALALSGFQRLRHVVLPQALRIMIPPVANQYLNLTKNSSLGVAVAYPEVTRVVRTAIGQQAPAPQGVAMLMLVYLGFSLAISLIANLVNRRLALRGR